MKPRRLTTARLSVPLAFAIAALLAAPVARATSYYWDANGALTTAVAPTGIWGTSSFWTTDSLGASATAAYAGDNTSDIYFCAGTLGTTGTVTVSGTQNASSITFDDPVAITLSGGTALNIGGTGVFSGIFVTANAVNTISTAITLNAAATIQNAGTSNQTISGGITGGQNLILNANGTGGLLFTTTTVNNAGTIRRSPAVDFSEAMLHRARMKPGAEAICFVRHDLAQPLPLASATFDRVFCCLVLDHIAELAPFFLELRRLCHPQGSVIISVMHPAMSLRGVQARFIDPGSGRRISPASHQHRMSDYLMAAVRAGLRLELASEYPADAALAAQSPRAGKYLGWPMLLLLKFVPG